LNISINYINITDNATTLYIDVTSNAEWLVMIQSSEGTFVSFPEATTQTGDYSQYPIDIAALLPEDGAHRQAIIYFASTNGLKNQKLTIFQYKP